MSFRCVHFQNAAELCCQFLILFFVQHQRAMRLKIPLNPSPSLPLFCLFCWQELQTSSLIEVSPPWCSLTTLLLNQQNDQKAVCVSSWPRFFVFNLFSIFHILLYKRFCIMQKCTVTFFSELPRNKSRVHDTFLNCFFLHGHSWSWFKLQH